MNTVDKIMIDKLFSPDVYPTVNFRQVNKDGVFITHDSLRVIEGNKIQFFTDLSPNYSRYVEVEVPKESEGEIESPIEYLRKTQGSLRNKLRHIKTNER